MGKEKPAPAAVGEPKAASLFCRTWKHRTEAPGEAFRGIRVGRSRTGAQMSQGHLSAQSLAVTDSSTVAEDLISRYLGDGLAGLAETLKFAAPAGSSGRNYLPELPQEL